MNENERMELFKRMLEDHTALFMVLSKKGVHEEVKRDFEEWMKVAEELFEQDPEGFTLDRVLVKIPSNRWHSIYIKHLP